MARFDLAIERILKWEGGYSNNPSDTGGATAFGISLKWYRQTVNLDANAADIAALTRDKAIGLYWQHFWRYDGIMDQPVAEKIFDLGVNMGPGTAHGIVQKAVNHVSGSFLKVDGVLGPKSIAAINAADPDALLGELRARAVERYAFIVLNDPTQKTFLLGWARRAVS